MRRRFALALLVVFGLHLALPGLAAAAAAPAARGTSVGAGDCGCLPQEWTPRAASGEQLGRLAESPAAEPSTGPCARHCVAGLHAVRSAPAPVASLDRAPMHRSGHRLGAGRERVASDEPS